MFLLSIFVSNFPSMALSEIFRTIQLPPTATGPESMAFELATGRFYVGVADGRILQYNGLTGFVEYGFTGGNRDAEKGSASNDSTGRLLMYNPNTRRVTVLLKNLPGPSGVAVSQDGSYVLVSNYNANNTIKFWLMGPRADTYDIVNTQARPNNIQRTLMGDYWQAAAMVKQSTQTLVPIGQRINSFGSVIQTANFERWYGNNLISEVQEFRGSLYIASPSVDFIGVYTI
ncbi:hypothetical protein V6N13_109336 [Hibiscus sabdariffa]